LHRFFDRETWVNQGGDFDTEPLLSTSISSSPQPVVFESSQQLVAKVQAWLDSPETNRGWILLGDEIFTRNARRILSREHSGPGNPLLRVEYALPPAVSVPTITLVGLLVLIIMTLCVGRRRLSVNRRTVNNFNN